MFTRGKWLGAGNLPTWLVSLLALRKRSLRKVGSEFNPWSPLLILRHLASNLAACESIGNDEFSLRFSNIGTPDLVEKAKLASWHEQPAAHRCFLSDQREVLRFLTYHLIYTNLFHYTNTNRRPTMNSHGWWDLLRRRFLCLLASANANNYFTKWSSLSRKLDIFSFSASA
jgi:hypothetical protein